MARGIGWQRDGWWVGCRARASAAAEEVGSSGRFQATGAEVCHMGTHVFSIKKTKKNII